MGQYLVGDQFSLADIFVAQTLFWAKEVKEIECDLDYFHPFTKGLKEREGFPNIKDYLPKNKCYLISSRYVLISASP